MTRALSGLSVLDFTTTIAGPHCTRLLADLGAEVIKIEAPEGDMMRSRMPLRNGVSASFGQLNAGKMSVVLDMKSAKAVEAVHRLVERADVVAENFRPGVMRRLGLDYAALGKPTGGSSIARSPATARPDRRLTFRLMRRSSMRRQATTSRIFPISRIGRGPTTAGSISPTFCPEPTRSAPSWRHSTSAKVPGRDSWSTSRCWKAC